MVVKVTCRGCGEATNVMPPGVGVHFLFTCPKCGASKLLKATARSPRRPGPPAPRPETQVAADPEPSVDRAPALDLVHDEPSLPAPTRRRRRTSVAGRILRVLAGRARQQTAQEPGGSPMPSRRGATMSAWAALQGIVLLLGGALLLLYSVPMLVQGLEETGKDPAGPGPGLFAKAVMGAAALLSGIAIFCRGRK
jgi:hypothetical protein